MFKTKTPSTNAINIVRNKSKFSLNNRLKPVIIKPAEMLPSATEHNDFQKPNPKNTATAVPVHTPVSGNGIATNKNTPIILIKSSVLRLSALFAFFLTLSAFDWNNPSTAFASPLNTLIYFIAFKIGISINSNIGATIIEPINA